MDKTKKEMIEDCCVKIMAAENEIVRMAKEFMPANKSIGLDILGTAVDYWNGKNYVTVIKCMKECATTQSNGILKFLISDRGEMRWVDALYFRQELYTYIIPSIKFD